MSTEHVGDMLAGRWEQIQQQNKGLAQSVKVFEAPKINPILIKPTAPSWEDLEKTIEQGRLINLPGVWITVRELYEQGFGAELLTLAEIVQAKHRKEHPYNMFTASISKKSGNWKKRTLQMVHETWEARRNTLEVMDKLNLPAGSTKAILALAWRLKGAIIRFLGIATEKNAGIRNAAGLFFALTKKPQPAAT